MGKDNKSLAEQMREEKRKAILEHIEEYGLMEYGGSLLKDFLVKFDMARSTWYDWLERDTDFAALVKKARIVFRDRVKISAESNLMRIANGYTYEEVKEEVGETAKGMINTRTVTRKHIAPNLGANIFILTNVDPDSWKNRQTNDVGVNFKENQEKIAAAAADFFSDDNKPVDFDSETKQ